MVKFYSLKIQNVIIVILFSFLPFTSFAQELDESFEMPIPVKAADISDIKVQEDGKILVGGDIKFFGEKKVHNLIRLNPDGGLDETFSFVPDDEVYVEKIGLLSSGEIIIGGKDLIKLSPSGQILGRNDNLQIATLNIQDDDKIIITVNEHGFTSSVYRYDKDLDLDSSFDQTNSLNSWVIDAALQNDKLIVTGTFSEVNGVSRNILARFNADGSWDEGFNVGLDPSNVIINLTVMTDGKIIFTASGIKGITRLNADGTADPSFSTSSQIGGSMSHIALKDGSILVAGYFSFEQNHQDIYLYKLKNNGELDQNFTPVLLFNLTPLASELPSEFLMASDLYQETLIINTPNNGNAYGLSKFDKEGQVNQTFQPEVGTYGEITTGDEYHGQIIIGGRFLRLGTVKTHNIAKLNIDGTVNPDFTAEPVLFENTNANLKPTQIKILHDDTILVALKHKLQRLNGEGKVDEQFISQGITDPALFAQRFSVLNNGKIVTASDYGVFMLNADGSEDLSFSSKKEVMVAGPAHIGLQSDGIVYTTNTARDGTISTKLYKVLLDGSMDDEFTTEVEIGANSFIHDINILENDAILGTGGFTQYRGEATKGLIKFFANGQLDESFVSNYNATVPESFSFFSQNVTFREGSIISAYSNLGRGYTIGFLNADGTYNTGFSLPEEITYVRDNIFSLVLSPDSIILLSRFELIGQDEPSFAIRLTFDDRPVISGTTSELSTLEDIPLELKLSNFIVSDKDSNFPDDFSLILYEGENYATEGTHIIPNTDFQGKLTVPVAVSDGKSESDIYDLHLKVVPVADTVESLSAIISGDSITNKALVQISFQDQVQDFKASDIYVSQGGVTTLTTEDSISFTADISPVSDGRLTVEVPAGVVFNKAGDTNPASKPFTLKYDGTSPTVKLSSLVSNNLSTLSIQLTFSEAVTGFIADDIEISNASISELASTDSITFTAQLLPELEGEINIAVPLAVTQDQAGNDNEASESLSLWYEQPSFTFTVEVNIPNETEFPSGKVSLYQKADGKFTELTTKDLAHTLAFDDLLEGQYTIGIQPTDQAFLPSYLGNELTLWEAKTIVLEQDTVQAITLLESADDPTVGGCAISGILLLDPEATHGRLLTGSASASGEVLTAVPVYLLHPETRSVLANATTDEQGRFSFMDLNIGDYLFVADYAGIPLDESQNLIQIQTEDESISVTAIAGTNIRITDIQSEKLVTSVGDEIEPQSIKYYPNPAEDKIFIEHGPEWMGGEISIHNILGKLIKTQSIDESTTELQIESLSPGVYFISLVNGKNYYSFKVRKR